MRISFASNVIVPLDASDDIRCIGQKLILSDVIHLRLLSEAACNQHALVPELERDARMRSSSIRQTLVPCAQCGFKT